LAGRTAVPIVSGLGAVDDDCAMACRPPARHLQSNSRLQSCQHWLVRAHYKQTLKGRQIAAEVERVGLRLQLRKQQAEAGDIVLLYGDESEALTHPYLARMWAKAGADLRVPAPGHAKKVAILGSLDHVTRELIVHTSPTKRSSDFVAHLEQLDRRYGPKPGQPAHSDDCSHRFRSKPALCSERSQPGIPMIPAG
jgi:hypothetical protein